MVVSPADEVEAAEIPVNDMLFWMSAQKGVETNGSNQVVKWTSQAGDCYAVPENGYAVSAGDGIVFQNSTLQMELSGNSFIGLEGATIVAYVKPQTALTAGNGKSNSYNSQRNDLFYVNETSKGNGSVYLGIYTDTVTCRIGKGNTDYGIHPDADGSMRTPVTSFSTTTVLWDTTSYTINVDGKQFASHTGAAKASANNQNTVYLGRGKAGASSEITYWNGVVCELMFFNKKLSEAELRGVYAYLDETYPSDVPVSGIYLEESGQELSLHVGDTYELTASVIPANATNQGVTWRSSNADAASVDANGKVSANGLGLTAIYAEAADGSCQAYCTVLVKEDRSAVLWQDIQTMVRWAESQNPNGYNNWNQMAEALQAVNSVSAASSQEELRNIYDGLRRAFLMLQTVSKVDYTGITTSSTSGKCGMTETYNLAAMLPEGYELGTITITDPNGIFAGNPTVSGTVLTYRLADEENNAGKTGTITIPVTESVNYYPFNLTIIVAVEKITPTLSLTAVPASLTGGGEVTLTLTGLPAGSNATVTCSGGITVTEGSDSTWTAILPNSTETYTFTAFFAGNASYHASSASCTVDTTEVVILPNPPDDDGDTKFRLVMETTISEVPEGLKDVEGLNTPEELIAAMKAEITEANSSVSQANTAVYDVELMVSTDGGATWSPATKENFPSGGLTVTLPYPEGTNSSYRFTVIHMFTTSGFGKQLGTTEVFTPDQVKNTAQGIQVVVTGLSPISVGWTAPAADSVNPPSGDPGGVTVIPQPGPSPEKQPEIKPEPAPETQGPCDGGADCPSRSFTDLGSVGVWYHEAVDYVLRNNLMGGYGNGTFGPDDTLSRAQLAQILYNKAGKPAVTGGSTFTDVETGAWYTTAITWAAERSIVGGYGRGMFGPNDNITREQLAVMLWRYVGSPEAASKELHFTDADKVNSYALDALRWAVENGIINGKSGGILDPGGLATRVQVAQMLKNFLKDE